MLKQRNKILLIALGQISTNPRLFKEAIWFSEKNFEVSVIYSFWSKWGFEYDKEICSTYDKIKWIEVGGNPIEQNRIYFLTRIKRKIFHGLSKILPNNISIAARAECRVYDEMVQLGLKISPNIIIAHNLGAITVAGTIAQQLSIPFVFDAEDFHRGQYIQNSFLYSRAKKIENYWMPKASLITSSSPLIATKYLTEVGVHSIVIHNVFKLNKSYFKNRKITGAIKFVWFSQTVGLGRGIEDFILALKCFSRESFSLTLIGYIQPTLLKHLLDLASDEEQLKIDIQFIDPVKPSDLFSLISQFDIGIAAETHININSQILLSNKLFTYLISGISIFFSQTPAQRNFLDLHPNIGWSYPCGNLEELKNQLLRIKNDVSLIEQCKSNAANLAYTKYNWDSEQEKLKNHLDLIDKLA